MKVRLSILVAGIAALSLVGASPGYARALDGVTPASLAQPVPNSTYSGTISGGGTVDFDVSPDGTKVTRFRAADVPGSFASCTSTQELKSPSGLPIVNNVFQGGGSTTFQFSGTFPASQQATGTVKITGPSMFGCLTNTLNWTASTTTPMPLVAQTITFPTPPDTPVNAGPVTLTAAASSGLPVSYTSDTPSVCTVSGVQAQLKAVGTCSITARQPGDGSYLAAPPVQRSFSVVPGPAPLEQTATVKVPTKITYRGKTVLLKKFVRTTAGQTAKTKVTVKPKGKNYSKVKTTSQGKVTIVTLGKKKLKVTLKLTAPAKGQYAAYSYIKKWTVKK